MTTQTRPLGSDIEIPLLGFGTYLIPEADTPAAVKLALEAGYRHIDTAEAYRNETGVGAAINDALASGLWARDELFITTKLWPGNPAWGMPSRGYDDTLAALEGSLERLGLDFVDLYLIHAPLATEARLDQWRALVELQRRGLTRAIGVSNYNQAHLDEIRAAGLPMPSSNQIELHPWSQKPALVADMEALQVQPIAYSSLVPLSTWRSAEGHASAKTDQMRAEGQRDESPFKVMARKYGVTEAQILLRWAVQKGYPVLPRSTKAERVAQNADLFSFELDAQDMADIEGMDRGDGVAWQSGDPLHSA